MASQRDLGALADPRRLARAFVAVWRRGWCDGVFVTAGVPKSATWGMEKLLEVVETLRFTLGFRGYVHVKIPSRADPRQLERIMGLVDRVSFQLEPACAVAEGETFPPEITSQRFAARSPARRRERPVRSPHHAAREGFAGRLRARWGGPLPAGTDGAGMQPALFDVPVPFANRP
jgi:hypothetical protein